MPNTRNRFLIVLFLAPALLGLGLFRLYPIMLAVFESLFSSFGGQRTFVGLLNYTDLFFDSYFWQSIKVTLYFNALINPLQVALALGLALLFVKQFKGASVYRWLFLVPIGVSLPTAIIIWRVMLLDNGFFNSLLGLAGFESVHFLTSEQLAIYSVIFIATWKGVSYWMIFIIGGLQNIPQDIYEAAKLEGARGWHTLTRITLPLLRPTLLFVLVADVSINFLLFAPMFMITNGGPNGSTNVLMYEAYQSGFVFGDMGRAMAIIVIIVLLLLAVVVTQFKLLADKK